VAQYRQLVAAGQLEALRDAPAAAWAEHGVVNLKFTLPRQAVSLILLEWP
jgi:hypothetical protein